MREEFVRELMDQHGVVSGNNLNNHRAKRRLLLQHRLQHQVE